MSEDNEGLWTLEKGCEYLGVGYAFGWREAQAGRMPGAFMLGGTEDPDTGRIKRGKWMIVPEVIRNWAKERAEFSLQGARLKMVKTELTELNQGLQDIQLARASQIFGGVDDVDNDDTTK